MAPIGREPKFWFWFGKALDVAIAVSFLRSGGARPLVSSASAISSSCDSVLLIPRARRGAAIEPRDGGAVVVFPALGGPGAIGTTPPVFELATPAATETPVLGRSFTEPVDFGDSESAALCDVGVVTGV